MKYQHRYIEYARDHGKTPEEMGITDEQRWPAGCMTGFICWISERWGEFSKTFKRDRYSHSLKDHDDFDSWLVERNKSQFPSEQMDLFNETIGA